MKKIGIYGGSFNPIHVGHLTAAEEAKKQLGLDRVIFVPAGNPYFKDQSELADFGARAAMVRDAIAGVPYFEVSEIEGNPRKPSYTSETLTFFHDHRKGAKLFLLVGADAFYQLHKWHDVDTILDLATIAVIKRDGKLQEFIEDYGQSYIDWKRTPQAKNMKRVDVNCEISLSSSYIRKQVKSNGSFRFLVPHGVYKRIVNSRLYDYGGDDFVIY